MEFDHVFVLGLERGRGHRADRPAGPRRARPRPGRARATTARARPPPFYADGAGRRRGRGGGPRGGAVRAGRGLHATYRMLREEVLEASWKAGRELSEPRLDTAIDVNRAIARYLELLKLAALAQRPGDEATAEAIEAVNGLLRQVATPEQQAELDASALDSYLLDSEREREGRRRLIAARQEPSLEAFLPRRGDGSLSLSASDLDLYLTCPLKYKFARVFGIPQEPTINQRFGILIHNVLERFHKDGEEVGEEDGLSPPDVSVRGGLAALRLRLQRRRAAVPRPGARGDAPLLGAGERSRGRAGLAGAQVRHPDRRAPRARPGRPGRPPARRRPRADRLQDRRTQERSRPGERPAAGPLPARRPRGLGPGGEDRQLLLRARRARRSPRRSGPTTPSGSSAPCSRSARESSARTSSRAPRRPSAAGATTA